jgi:hypothetical protein
MIKIKLCAYINLLLTNYAADSMFYKWVDVIEPKILGELTNGEWIIYNQTIGIY